MDVAGPAGSISSGMLTADSIKNRIIITITLVAKADKAKRFFIIETPAFVIGIKIGILYYMIIDGQNVTA